MKMDLSNNEAEKDSSKCSTKINLETVIKKEEPNDLQTVSTAISDMDEDSKLSIKIEVETVIEKENLEDLPAVLPDTSHHEESSAVSTCSISNLLPICKEEIGFMGGHVTSANSVPSQNVCGYIDVPPTETDIDITLPPDIVSQQMIASTGKAQTQLHASRELRVKLDNIIDVSRVEKLEHSFLKQENPLCISQDPSGGDVSYLHTSGEYKEILAEQEKYECPSCNSKFSCTEALTPHLNVCAKQKKTCRTCSKTFSNLKYLKLHLKTHKGEMPSDQAEGSEAACRFSCDQCTKSFRRRQRLLRHISRCHSTIRWRCVQCGQIFKRSDYLRNHQTRSGCQGRERIHQDPSVSPGRKAPLLGRRCSLAVPQGKRPPRSRRSSTPFSTRSSTRVGSRFSCEQCNKSFRRRRELSRHISRCHSTIRWRCVQCSTLFRRTDSLKVHQARFGCQGREVFRQDCTVSPGNEAPLPGKSHSPALPLAKQPRRSKRSSTMASTRSSTLSLNHTFSATLATSDTESESNLPGTLATLAADTSASTPPSTLVETLLGCTVATQYEPPEPSLPSCPVVDQDVPSPPSSLQELEGSARVRAQTGPGGFRTFYTFGQAHTEAQLCRPPQDTSGDYFFRARQEDLSSSEDEGRQGFTEANVLRKSFREYGRRLRSNLVVKTEEHSCDVGTSEILE